MNDDGNAADPPDELAPGVRALDHTADAGLAIEAVDLPSLFARAALGMEAVIAGDRAPALERPEDAPAGEFGVALEADDVALLLADWLRELLFQRQVRGRSFAGVAFTELSETRLVARVAMAPARAGAVREIKGVTYHGLSAERSSGGWRARIIFDV